jgi:transcriptional regulator with XRE-family HTH domain
MIRYKYFAKRVKEGRIKCDIGLRELARKLTVSPSYVFVLESGGCRPSDDIVLKLGKVLNIETDELMILIGKVPPDVSEYIIKNPKVLKKLRKEMRTSRKLVEISGNCSEGT